MNILQDHIELIRKTCASHSVRGLDAFGSVLRNDFKATSDIDLVVDFDDMDPSIYADNYFDLKESLERILKHPVDLLEENSIRNPYFRKILNSQRFKIYGD